MESNIFVYVAAIISLAYVWIGLYFLSESEMQKHDSEGGKLISGLIDVFLWPFVLLVNYLSATRAKHRGMRTPLK